MVAAKTNGIKPVMAHDDQEANLAVVDGVEEWHRLDCGCEPCAVENGRREAAVDANLLAGIQEATAAEVGAAKWLADYKWELFYKARYFGVFPDATEAEWQAYKDCPSNPVKLPLPPKLPIEPMWDGDAKQTVSGKNSEGLSEALRGCMVRLRYNARAHRAELANGLYEWEPLTDRIVAKLREVLSESFVYIGPPGKDGSEGEPKALKFGRDSWADVLNVLLYGSEVDPFIEWLESLGPWDGTKRLDLWLTRMFTINKWLPLAEWAGRFMVLGAVWRTYEPGLKLDELPVLIGKGGIGKSTCARFLLPADRGDWFSDGLYLAADSKVRAEALLGRVVVEAAEMQGSTRADLESLKAFLSRTDDGAVRLAYRKDPELLLRRCVIVGTADRAEPLPNDSNLRRFVPVFLDAGNPALIREYMDANRAQLWAEALHLYRRGVEARLPDELKGLQSEATDRARSRDTVIEDAVSEWTWGNDGFTMAELAAGVHLIDSNDKGAKLQMRDQHRLGQVLESFGYAKRRRRGPGVQVTRWYRGESGERVHSNS